jgi:hypothetical protein
MYKKSKFKPAPNPNKLTAQACASEFVAELIDEIASRITNLIQRNATLGGDPRGYTFQGIDYSGGYAASEYIPPIDPTLETEAYALYLRTNRLQVMRSKLEQALASILQRCGNVVTTFRDALPDEFIERVSLDVYPRTRPYGFMLKAHPMLEASYRVIEEALVFVLRYRLLD